MSKLPWFCFFIIVAFGCGNNNSNKPQSTPVAAAYQGLIIDSSVKNKVISKKDKTNDSGELFLASLDIKAFENDKPIERLFRTGSPMPCYVVSYYVHDTLSIGFNPMLGGSFGFIIQKYKDSCKVWHVFSIHEAATGPYKLHADDSLTKPGLSVPCKFTVILNQRHYKRNETVYGFVEGVSDDYYIKTDSVDTKTKIEFKGYFRATVASN